MSGQPRGRRAPSYSPLLLGTGQRIGHALSRALFDLTVVGAHYVPPSGPVLLAGNHSGFLDGPLVMAWSPRPLRVLAKSELFRGPVGPALVQLGQLPLRRGTPDRRALGAAVDVLRGGGALGIFPEGTRGDGDLSSVKDGVGYLLVKQPCPVVPVACIGTKEAWPKGSWRPRWRRPVRVDIGPAFEVRVEGDPSSRATMAAVAEQVRLQLRAHLGAALARAGHPELGAHDDGQGAA